MHALHEGAAKLEQGRHELQTLADNLPAIVSRFDRDLRHVFINSTIERVTGRPRTDFIGKTNRDLGMPDDKCDQWDAALRGVFATGQPASLTFDFPSPDGQRHFVNHIVPERGPDGTIEHALAVVTDVTELERTQHQPALALEQSRKATVAREQVLSLVSHDLKNPLATVMLAVGNLERQLQRGSPVDPNRVSQVLGRVLSQSQRMRRMVDELLDVAWLQSGEALALERRATDLVALVHTLVDEEQRATNLHRLEVDAVLPTVTGRWDAHRIERVVANLISNAIKYSPNGGRVRCEVKVEASDAGRLGGAARLGPGHRHLTPTSAGSSSGTAAARTRAEAAFAAPASAWRARAASSSSTGAPSPSPASRATARPSR
ncbi:MAG: PAS domain-containing protein [Archangiaceae bacterium]|nr:PAS domain-containing protein [Archangiaceae bacterium]